MLLAPKRTLRIFRLWPISSTRHYPDSPKLLRQGYRGPRRAGAGSPPARHVYRRRRRARASSPRGGSPRQCDGRGGGRPCHAHRDRARLGRTGSRCATTAAAFRSMLHPRFAEKSALEVILTTLHSGGKFGGDAYRTSGGLHGVGVSVVNALSDELEVEVARDRQLWSQSYRRGVPQTGLSNRGPVNNRRGTMLRFHPDPEIFGEHRISRGDALPHGAVEGLSLPRPGNSVGLRSGAASPGRRSSRGSAALSGRARRFSRGEPRGPRRC